MGNPSIFSPSTSINSYSKRYDCTNTKQTSSLFFCDSIPDDDKPQPYLLDSCFLCKTPIHLGDDIYMYRGDAPFCSEECRQQQIEIDDANDRNINMKKKEKGSNKSLDISSRSNAAQVRAAAASVAG